MLLPGSSSALTSSRILNLVWLVSYILSCAFSLKTFGKSECVSQVRTKNATYLNIFIRTISYIKQYELDIQGASITIGI